jgi:hypothetical protein
VSALAQSGFQFWRTKPHVEGPRKLASCRTAYALYLKESRLVFAVRRSSTDITRIAPPLSAAEKPRPH